MSQPLITIIAAIADNNVIGSSNDLPWYIPEDLKHFKTLTTGKTVLMGKKTFDSIIQRLGKPLPNRKNIVLMRQDEELHEDVVVINDIESALSLPDEEIMIIGGGQVYKQFLPFANRLEITHVHSSPTGDVYFPEIDWNQWKKINEENHEGFSFTSYEKI